MGYDFHEYIGIPFVEHGRTRNGCDCWGLVRLFYKEQMDIDLPSHADKYDDVMEAKRISEAIEDGKDKWLLIPEGTQVAGDVALLRVRGYAYHVGIIVDQIRMIHAISGIESCMESYKGLLWQRRIEGIYRYVG